MKIGDTVRFLNATGGGRISRVDEKKGLVYVEDADGFEIPALAREVVVVDNVSEATNVPKRNWNAPQAAVAEEKPVAVPPPPAPEPLPVLETPDGDTAKVLLAFFPTDIKHLQTCSYECYLVNDSNYYLYYNMVNGAEDARRSVAHGEIEPNMQEFVAEVSKDDLNDWEHLQVQAVAFKQGKAYAQQPVMDVAVRLNAVKFYKLHSFVENEYFDDPALLVNLSEERERQELAAVSPDEIRTAILAKDPQPVRPAKPAKPERKNGVVEVDLHIGELLDTTAGMSNADMLQCQLDKFHAVMEEYKGKTGQKIVFIHGKGEGVLRKEIEKQLKTKYRHCYYQDASFREYGFGATMVTIRKPRP